MNNGNLIPGAHKLTDEDRRKGKEARRVNNNFRKMAKKLRGTAWLNEDDAKLFSAFDIPEQEQTLGMMIVLRTAVKAAAGDKDARRDFMRMTGDDPDVAVREEELKIKREAVGKATERSDVEDLSILAELINGPDADDRVE